MKNLIIAAVAVAVVSFAGSAFAGDISNDMLSDMGLGNMQSMSDDQGMDVRGSGYYGYGSATATVSGFVSVHIPGVYIFEKKYASERGSVAYAEGGFNVAIYGPQGAWFVSESGYAKAGVSHYSY